MREKTSMPYFGGKVSRVLLLNKAFPAFYGTVRTKATKPCLTCKNLIRFSRYDDNRPWRNRNARHCGRQ